MNYKKKGKQLKKLLHKADTAIEKDCVYAARKMTSKKKKL